jgi:hypothetical protein
MLIPTEECCAMLRKVFHGNGGGGGDTSPVGGSTEQNQSMKIVILKGEGHGNFLTCFPTQKHILAHIKRFCRDTLASSCTVVDLASRGSHTRTVCRREEGDRDNRWSCWCCYYCCCDLKRRARSKELFLCNNGFSDNRVFSIVSRPVPGPHDSIVMLEVRCPRGPTHSWRDCRVYVCECTPRARLRVCWRAFVAARLVLYLRVACAGG